MTKHYFAKFEEDTILDIGNHKINSYITTYINPKHVQAVVGGEAKNGVDIYLVGREKPITVSGYIEDIIDELEDAI